MPARPPVQPLNSLIIQRPRHQRGRRSCTRAHLVPASDVGNPDEYERSRWGNSSPSPIPRAPGYAVPDRMRRIADAGTGAGFRGPRSSRSAAPRPFSASRPSLTPPLKVSEGDPALEQHRDRDETSDYHI
jgi:hypothetical protein